MRVGFVCGCGDFCGRVCVHVHCCVGGGAGVPRAGHGGGVEDRGQGLPCVHCHGRQGCVVPVLAHARPHASPPPLPLRLPPRTQRVPEYFAELDHVLCLRVRRCRQRLLPELARLDAPLLVSQDTAPPPPSPPTGIVNQRTTLHAPDSVACTLAGPGGSCRAGVFGATHPCQNLHLFEGTLVPHLGRFC